jgi:hypothetical protein
MNTDAGNGDEALSLQSPSTVFMDPGLRRDDGLDD